MVDGLEGMKAWKVGDFVQLQLKELDAVRGLITEQKEGGTRPLLCAFEAYGKTNTGAVFSFCSLNVWATCWRCSLEYNEHGGLHL